MNEAYLQTKIDGKQAYLRIDSLDKLRKADVIIFDCDGVLIDINNSCNKTISETVAYLIRELTGFHSPRSLISKEIIHLFKKSGGFNNDWDLTYVLLMFVLSRFSEKSQIIVINALNLNRESDLFKYFLSVRKNILGNRTILDDLDNLLITLKDLVIPIARKLDSTGLPSFEKELIPLKASKVYLDYISKLKNFLSHPGNINESIPITVFEEIFCGSQVFKKNYKVAPRFYKGKGLIENENIIILPNVLDQLVSMMGTLKLGISSGRPFELAKHTIGSMFKAFNPNALVFLDNIQAAEKKRITKGQTFNLTKPNPFSLFASSKEMEPFNSALYIGDSMEDVIMAKNAKKLDNRFLFAGVYSHTNYKEDTIRTFLEERSEIILPSVNELPTVLKALREGCI